MGRGAWRAEVHGVAKESDTTEVTKQQDTMSYIIFDYIPNDLLCYFENLTFEIFSHFETMTMVSGNLYK